MTSVRSQDTVHCRAIHPVARRFKSKTGTMEENKHTLNVFSCKLKQQPAVYLNSLLNPDSNPWGHLHFNITKASITSLPLSQG